MRKIYRIPTFSAILRMPKSYLCPSPAKESHFSEFPKEHYKDVGNPFEHVWGSTENEGNYANPEQNKILQISSWNIDTGRNIESILKALKTNTDLSGSDVIALQEVDRFNERTDNKDLPKIISEETGFYYVYAIEFLEFGRTGFFGEIGNMLLSRHPIKEPKILRLTSGNDWYGNKSLQKRMGDRMAIGGTISVNGIDIKVYSTRLENHTSPYYRRKQMEDIISDSRKNANPVVIAGDFNTMIPNIMSFSNILFRHREYPLDKLIETESYADPFGLEGKPTHIKLGGLGFLSKTLLRGILVLDGIISNGIDCIESRIINGVHCSDHYPITATYRL